MVHLKRQAFKSTNHRGQFMSAIIQNISNQQIHDEIKTHPAWRGSISGLKAEKMLRGQAPYLYILRMGHFENEYEVEYYATFVHSDGTVRHQPFVITSTRESWIYENGNVGSPHEHGSSSINDVLHLIMHCSQEEARSFSLFIE